MKKITIDVQHLTKVFSGLRAVNDVSLKIASGEFFGLLGPNGSGKTTMIKCMTGQIKPSEGSITVLGINALKDPIKVRELCGIIPEQENPPSFLTAVEYLYYVGKIRKIEKLEEKTAHWLKLLDFADQKDILCKDLSRGTRQKLMFAQAFIHEPKLAFIDEPLINLDPLTQKKVKDFLRKYVKNGNTVFFSTHVLEIAEELCTSMAVLDRGQILFQGSMKQKKKQSLENFFIKLVKDAKSA